MSEKFLLLDTETTGLKEPRLVTLAYSVDGESMVNYGMFKPPIPIEPGASMANHITNDMVKDAPTFTGSADFLKLQELLNTHTLVAHSAAFDARVLANEGLTVRKILDTCELAKRCVTGAENFKLQYLRYFLNLNCAVTAHTSLGDVIVLKALFQKLKTLAPQLFPTPSAQSQLPLPEVTTAVKVEIPTKLTAY